MTFFDMHVFLFFQTEKLTGQCAVLRRDKRFVYYLVKCNIFQALFQVQ